jgi:hypothetical protein
MLRGETCRTIKEDEKLSSLKIENPKQVIYEVYRLQLVVPQ